jgi:SAM-dependent methyltransferase
MGIDLSIAYLSAKVLDPIEKKASKRVLTLGLQDCSFTYEEACSVLRKAGTSWQEIPPIDLRLGESAVFRGPENRPIIHQKSFFRMLGFVEANVKALDASAYEGADFVCDLNLPVPESLVGSQDVVFDGGTLEHVFSVKDAFANVKALLAVGGLVIHLNPADHVGHGFYCFSAGLYDDFYMSNGFEQVYSKYIAFSSPLLRNKHFLEFAPDKVGWSVSPHYTLYCMSAYRKVRDVPLVVPQQGLYRKVWADGAASSVPPRGAWLRRFALWGAFASLTLGAAALAHYQIRKGRRVQISD